MRASSPGSAVPPWSDLDHRGSVVDRFRRVAAAVPDNIALVDGKGRRLSYRQLEAAAVRLAADIAEPQETGSGRVAVYSDMAAEAVVAMLGVVVAGKAYVPIDPTEPAARTAAKLTNAEIGLVVAPESLASQARAVLDGTVPVTVIDVDIAASPRAAPAVSVRPDDHFNLIYTSGSTGAPKGVIQNHRNVLFDTDASTGLFPVIDTDIFGLVIPLTFGASVSDVAGALLNGATLDILDLRLVGIEAMAQWMREHAITITHLVPTVLRRWMNAIEETDRYPAMRMVKAGGESLLRRDLESFAAHFDPDCILRNGLGTTETYLIAAEMFRAGDGRNDAILPVGRAAPGRTVAILDDDGSPMPHGETGQIAVTSRYLSPGYWNDPAETAHSYRTDPERPDVRTYLSGDLGRLRSDGKLEHVGRSDDMVKVRGQRVELFEVEAALLDQPGIVEAAVVAQQAPDGENRLVAYVVGTGAMPPPAALRTGLALILPQYMIPAQFVPMESLPTLHFGKVDRRRLPDPSESEPNAVVSQAPRTEMEAKVAAIACDLLGVERIGTGDDLFAVGLDSLSATQLAARLTEAVGADIAVNTVFETPSVEAIAAALALGSTPAPARDLEDLLADVEGLSDQAATGFLEDSVS